jgi:hypothetical protein
MHLSTATLLAALATAVSAAQNSRTFAVNHFYGNGPLTQGRMDPIVNPGVAAGHHHTIQGGSSFGLTVTDTQLQSSACTSSLIKNDKSNYWTPSLFFQDPKDGLFTPVPLFYMNVYYLYVSRTPFSGDALLNFPTASNQPTIRSRHSLKDFAWWLATFPSARLPRLAAS